MNDQSTLDDLRQQFFAEMRKAVDRDENDLDGFAAHVDEAAKIHAQMEELKKGH